MRALVSQLKWFSLSLVVVIGQARFTLAATEPDQAQFAEEQEQKNVKAKPPSLLPTPRPGFGKTPEASKYQEICSGVRIEDPKRFAFTDMEKRLMCGDGGGGIIGIPWKDIPANQAAYFLRGFLQNRGYHEPEFDVDGPVLFVRAGRESELKRFRIIGGPESWDPPKKRLVDGNPLTPGLLDELQGWALSQIKDEGYPCALATTRADPATGEVLVRLRPGEQKRFVRIVTTGDQGLSQGALDRYNAFRLGDVYRERLVELTKRRIVDSGFLQTFTMSSRCDADGAAVIRDVILGPAHTIRFGVGGDTEYGALVRGIITQNRIGSDASSATGQVDLHYLNPQRNWQLANARYRWYYAPGEARNYIEPSIQFNHRSETAYETQSATVRAPHGWNHEYNRGQLDFQVGPSALYSVTSRGDGPPKTFIVYADTVTKWTDHDYEYYLTSPRTGESLELDALFTFRHFGANFTSQKLRFTGEKLWNVFRYDPPLFVLGWRFDVNSIFSTDSNTDADVPLEFRTFIGGDHDLRGFESQSLPRDRKAALSAATTGLEARFHKVLFRRVDIFTFVDSGVLGGMNAEYNTPVFMSPGFGLRWESPVGVLRGFAANRFALFERAEDAPYGSAWRLGVTFGEEF